MTDALEAIAELKDHFTANKGGHGEITSRKITDALRVSGAAAWLIHNAVKRNNDKYRHSLKKGTDTPSIRREWPLTFFI